MRDEETDGAPTAREREVRSILDAGERDGLTLKATAARAGIPAGTLAWWRGELRRREGLRAGGASPAAAPGVRVVVASSSGVGSAEAERSRARSGAPGWQQAVPPSSRTGYERERRPGTRSARAWHES